ncbi:hypothetical protein ACQJBY_071043 [Aegilops geniculata]
MCDKPELTCKTGPTDRADVPRTTSSQPNPHKSRGSRLRVRCPPTSRVAISPTEKQSPARIVGRLPSRCSPPPPPSPATASNPAGDSSERARWGCARAAAGAWRSCAPSSSRPSASASATAAAPWSSGSACCSPSSATCRASSTPPTSSAPSTPTASAAAATATTTTSTSPEQHSSLPPPCGLPVGLG